MLTLKLYEAFPIKLPVPRETEELSQKELTHYSLTIPGLKVIKAKDIKKFPRAIQNAAKEYKVFNRGPSFDSLMFTLDFCELTGLDFEEEDPSTIKLTRHDTGYEASLRGKTLKVSNKDFKNYLLYDSCDMVIFGVKEIYKKTYPNVNCTIPQYFKYSDNYIFLQNMAVSKNFDESCLRLWDYRSTVFKLE